MSVLALIVKENDYVLMAGDGASTDPQDGSMAGYASKIAVLPHLDAVIGETGMCGLTGFLNWFMPPQVATFDDLIEILPGLIRHCWDFIGAFNLATGGRHKSCIVAAGWSNARQRYEGWRVMTYEKETISGVTGEKTSLKPFVAHLVNAGGMWASAGPEPDVLRRFGVMDGPEDATDVDLLARMVSAARADSGVRSEDDISYNAGAFIQIAHLTRGYVQTSIMHRWPEDVPGKPVDPACGKPLPDWLMQDASA